LQNYRTLLGKLEEFIKRYYYNKIIYGLILFVLLVGGLYLFFSIVEYFGYLSKYVRAFLLFSFIIINLIILIKFIINPILGLFKIRRSLTYYEAADILGKHFKNEIDDKILNALQLNEILQNQKSDIVIAGIEQKSKKLLFYQFNTAVNLKKNYSFIPIVSLLILFLAFGIYYAPTLFKDPAERILYYDIKYSKPAPFEIFIKNSSLETYINESFLLEINTSGSKIPQDVFIESGNRNFRMDKKSNNCFSYLFRNLSKNTEFYFNGGGYIFGPYTINVKVKPVIKSFSVALDYPKYTGKSNEQFLNAGNLRIPEGTNIKWNFFTEFVDNIVININDNSYKAENVRIGLYNFEKTIKESFKYNILTYSSEELLGDSLGFYIEMIPDRFPLISVEEQRDQVLVSHTFFRGIINDDYGFSNLNFLYRIFNPKYNQYYNESFNIKPIKFDPNSSNQTFYYHFSLSDIDIRPGEIVEYFFIVWDNDGINGPKSSKSNLFTFNLPSYEDMFAETVANDQQVMKDLQENKLDVKKAFEDLDALKKSMLETDKVTWEQENILKEILDKKDALEKAIQDISDLSKQNEMKSSQFGEENQKIKEKHDELQRLFNEIMTDEMKELFKKIQEEMEKLGKEELFEKLDQMQFEMKDLERKLDRMLELYKQLELERILNESINTVERALEEQNDAIDKNTNNANSEDVVKEQEEVEELFERAKDLLKDFEEKNSQLSKPNETADTKDIQKEIEKNIEDALKELQNNKNNRAKPHQKNSKNNLQNMKKMLEKMQDDLFMDSMAEDARAIRQLMENLLKTSFNQEDLIAQIKDVNYNDPKYIVFIQQQRKIMEDLKFVEDSLVAIAKRQIMVKDFITREIAEINMNVSKALDDLVERRRHAANSRQQFAMMHINNLVLLLNESLQNMMSQMAGQGDDGKPSKQMGEGDKPSMQNLREMQEQMNKMLEQLQQGMPSKPGESAEGKMSMSESLARMAAEQQAIRNMLKEIADQFSKDGLGNEDLNNIISEMERTEMDIVRKNINRQTILRQERILTRLLEHEKAEIEREKEEKRKGTTAKNYEISNPEEIFEYNRKRNREIEMLKSLPPGFKTYYRNLIENYFLNIDTE